MGPSPAAPTREGFRTRHSLEFGGARRYPRDSRNRDLASGKPSPMGRWSLHGHLRGGTPFYMPGALFSQGRQKGKVLGGATKPTPWQRGPPCLQESSPGVPNGGAASSQTTPHTAVRVLNLVMHSTGMEGNRRVFGNGLGRAAQSISSCALRRRGTLALGPPGGLRHLWEGKGHRESLWWLGGDPGPRAPLGRLLAGGRIGALSSTP